jgi:hypothetical protein
MNVTPVINFDNTENAFAYKSDKELKKAHFLFSLMGEIGNPIDTTPNEMEFSFYKTYYPRYDL